LKTFSRAWNTFAVAVFGCRATVVPVTVLRSLQDW
jgi:hypothetical protein